MSMIKEPRVAEARMAELETQLVHAMLEAEEREERIQGLQVQVRWLTQRKDQAEESKARLWEMLRETIEVQAEWEAAVAKVLGRPPEVFERVVDRARVVLDEEEAA